MDQRPVYMQHCWGHCLRVTPYLAWLKSTITLSPICIRICSRQGCTTTLAILLLYSQAMYIISKESAPPAWYSVFTFKTCSEHFNLNFSCIVMCCTVAKHSTHFVFYNNHRALNGLTLALHQLCSKFCLLCFQEFPKNLPYYVQISAYYA